MSPPPSSAAKGEHEEPLRGLKPGQRWRRTALLACIAATVLALATALYRSDWPAGYALRYALWRLESATDQGFVGGDAELRYIEAGTGPALVLLHGGGGNRDAFFSQLPLFARHFHVYALDTRGHGHSEAGAGEPDYQRYAEDVQALLDHAQVARATVVGWSDGGNTGLLLALDHPERLCRLVLIGANFNPSGLARDPEAPPPPAHAWTTAIAARIYAWWRTVRPLHQPTGEQLNQLWASGPNLEVGDLARIHAPVLVLGGEYDVISHAHFAATKNAIPGAKMRIFRGAGHSALHEVPAEFNRVLRDFLLDAHGQPRPCEID